MKKYLFINMISLLLFIGSTCFGSDEKFKTKLSAAEIELVEAALPKDLFESLGGKSNINTKSKEIRLSTPLFETTGNEVSIGFMFEECDFSTSQLPPRKDIDQAAKDFLKSKWTAVDGQR